MSVRKHARKVPISRHDLSPRQRSELVKRGRALALGKVFVKKSSSAADTIIYGKPEIGQFILNEKIADSIDNLLGWNIVPPTELRLVKKRRRGAMSWERDMGVSMQQFVDAVEWDDAAPTTRYRVRKEELIKLVLFDVVLGQTDRHGGNVMIEPNTGKLWAIDNERMLWHDYGGIIEAGEYGLEAADRYGVLLAPIPKKLRDDLKNLDKGDFYAALAGHPRNVIEDAWKRKTLIESFGHVPTDDEWRDAAYQLYGEDIE